MLCAAVHQVVNNNLKGLEAFSGVGQVPRNQQQASDFNVVVLLGQQKRMSTEGHSDDPWYRLFNTSKSKCRETAFVRNVRVGGEPLCMLASDRQLKTLSP